MPIEESLRPFYSLIWVDDPESYGLARPMDEGSDFDKYIRRRKRRTGVIDDWVEQRYRLVGGGFSDYQAEVRGLRLCSEKLKEILERERGDSDELQWLPAHVIGPDEEIRRYWVLHFPKSSEDLLDIDRSTYGPFDEVMRGVIDPVKAAGRHVLPSPDSSFVSFLVSVKVRGSIMAAGCQGVELEPYPS